MEEGKEKSTVGRIIENLFAIHPMVTKAMMREAKARYHLSPGSVYMLWLMNRYDTLTMSEISIKLSIPKSHVTVLADKLIAEGLAERIDDPNDRRIVQIKLTGNGKKEIDILRQSIGQDMRQRIQTLDEEKIKLMLESSQFVRETLFKIMTDPIPADHP